MSVTSAARVTCASGVTLLLVAWLGQGFGWWRTPGVRLAGVTLASEPLRATLQQRAQVWNAQSIALQVGYQAFQPTRTELGFALRVEDAERELRELGHSTNPIVAMHALWTGLLGAGHALRWQPRLVDGGRLDRYVERLRADLERLPIPGSYAPDGSKIAGLAGEALDGELVRRAIVRAVVRGAAELKIPTIVTAAPLIYQRFTRPEAAATRLMFAQDTTYRPGTGRATNIELAARLLDGTLLMPGAPLSFNALVGKREAARGFAKALELVNGELAEGIGGGVCQVAGTLHAAAFYAGLTVEEYHAHSRLNRFAYLQPGLDAMVAWPEQVRELRDTKDLRLRNPYPFPVLIRTGVIAAGQQKSLRVQLFGSAPPFRVEFQFAVLERVPEGEIRRADDALGVGVTEVQQEGMEGLVIARRRTIYTPGGAVFEERRVAYPSTPRILRVGTRPPPVLDLPMAAR